MKWVLVLIALLLLTSCSIEESPTDPAKPPVSEVNPEGKLYFGFMIHVEKWQDEVENQESFEKHCESIEEMVSILEEYGAKGTFEFGPVFIEAAKKWDSNIIQELHDRGHGVGVHADAGYYKDDENKGYDFFVREIKDMRINLEELVDFKILHVSGICSELDWANAALDAGYKFTTGSVGYCAMSMPEDLRPEEYKDCAEPIVCHGPIPEDLVESLEIYQADSADDWLYSKDGKLIILNPRDLLYTLSGNGKSGFTSEDLDVSYDDIEVALDAVEPGKISLLYYGWSIGDEDLYDKELLRGWLSEIDTKYVETGKVEWKTLPEVYLEYVG